MSTISLFCHVQPLDVDNKAVFCHVMPLDLVLHLHNKAVFCHVIPLPLDLDYKTSGLSKVSSF